MQTPFLTAAEIQAVVKDIDFRLPGWDLYVHEDQYLGPYLRFIGRVPDTHNPGEMLDLGINSRVPPCQTREHLMAFIMHRWVEIWVHEARESLWYQGLPWDDPHANE